MPVVEPVTDAGLLRAWWFERQGLMRPDSGLGCADVLARTGWARSVGGSNPYLTLGGVQDLPSHGIFDHGRLIGFWEFDPAVGHIVWVSFIPRTPELEAAVGRTEAFVRDQLGDAHSFSLDSAESRRPRIEALREVVAA